MVDLRERTEHHVRIYFERTQDPEIQALIPQNAKTVEDAISLYEKTLLPGATSFGRTIYWNNQYVGDIWCYCINHEEEPNAMISYCLFEKSLWNKGIATEATRQFLEEIIHRFSLETVGAFTYCDNVPSIHVLKKNGFRKVESFAENGRLSAYFQKG